MINNNNNIIINNDNKIVNEYNFFQNVYFVITLNYGK